MERKQFYQFVQDFMQANMNKLKVDHHAAQKFSTTIDTDEIITDEKVGQAMGKIEFLCLPSYYKFSGISSFISYTYKLVHAPLPKQYITTIAAFM